MAELDLSSIWSWTLPLWGLFLVTVFMGSLLTETSVLEAIPASASAKTIATGGSRRKH